MGRYGYSVEIPEGYDEAVVRTRLALKTEGFSILTESHVAGLVPSDSDAGTERQYLIMGAWAPPASRRDLGGLEVAVQLPCNVVVQETDKGALVAALDPGDDVDVSDASSMTAADGAREALQRVLARVSAAG